MVYIFELIELPYGILWGTQISKWINSQAALHNPDQVAGGNVGNVRGVGDRGVNSSIGSQWRYRIDVVDEQIQRMAENMTAIEKNSTYLNVKLTYKGEQCERK